MTTNAVPDAVSLQEIQDETLKDPTSQHLADVLLSQRWHEANSDVNAYKHFKQELTVANGVFNKRHPHSSS